MYSVDLNITNSYNDKMGLESGETVSDDNKSRLRTIRVETNEFINEISKREKYVTEMLEIEGENPERDKETTKRQDKNNNKEYNKGNKGSFTTQELENDKKDKKATDSNISIIRKPLTNIMYVEENPERDKNKTKKQDIINSYHRNKDIIRFRNLQIWKLLNIKNIYYTMNEIVKTGIEAEKYENRNISEAKIHKVWKIEKLVQGTRNRCEALNYTKRGKRQQIYNYFYNVFILYTTTSSTTTITAITTITATTSITTSTTTNTTTSNSPITATTTTTNTNTNTIITTNIPYYYISFKFLFYTLYIFYIPQTQTHTHTNTHTHKHTHIHT